MKKIALNPEQLRVDSFHVEVRRDGAPGTVHGHRAGEGGADFVSVRPNSQCPVDTCAATCATLICFC